MELHSAPSYNNLPYLYTENTRTMSRKRPLQNADTSSTKRYLNGALAAELRGMRISRAPSNVPQPSAKNAFGVSVPPSPFYSNNFNPQAGASSFTQYPSGVAFGSDFVGSLPTEPVHIPQPEPLGPDPVVTDPDPSNSSSSSTPMEDDEIEPGPTVRTEAHNLMEDLTIEECDPVPSTENRLVVYRPPIRTKSNLVSRVNAVLPDGSYILRNPKTDEWIFTARNRSETSKRKLALVPWNGDPQKKLRESLHHPGRIIPMPWHDMPTEVTVVEPLDEIPAAPGDDMEIEEIV